MTVFDLFPGDDYLFTQMFVGCWLDASQSNPDLRDFHTYLVKSWSGMTLAYCIPACKSRGFPIAAVQVSGYNINGRTGNRLLIGVYVVTGFGYPPPAQLT